MKEAAAFGDPSFRLPLLLIASANKFIDYGVNEVKSLTDERSRSLRRPIFSTTAATDSFRLLLNYQFE